MKVGFDGAVAVVTGAGGGLGRAHALLLASRGARVVVNDIGGVDAHAAGPAADAARVVEEIRAAGGEAVADTHSVTTEEGARAIAATALDAYGRLDILVNNAGILRSVPFDEMTVEVWEEVVDVHLRGSFLVARAAWPHLRAGGSGRIVNTSSNSGLLGIAGSSAYGSAKAGLVGLTRVLALEGAAHGINVNAVAPIAYTRMSSVSRAAPRAWRTGEGDAWSVRLDPALVAPVVAWLSHPDCEVTGEVFSVGGGRVARFFLGLTEGFAREELDVEDVRDQMDRITDEAGYRVHASAAEEFIALHHELMD